MMKLVTCIYCCSALNSVTIAFTLPYIKQTNQNVNYVLSFLFRLFLMKCPTDLLFNRFACMWQLDLIVIHICVYFLKAINI